MERDMTTLNIRKHPSLEGCYLTGDGYLADLGWNPAEQLARKTRFQEVRVQRQGTGPKAYEAINDIRIEIDNPLERIPTFFTCDWCGNTEGVRQDGICLSCRYRVCASCGQMYQATSKNSRTCSSDCAEILRAERGRWLILERDDFTCIYCGFSAPNDAARLHVDHIIPVKDGGTSHAGNLITACLACNSEKSARRLTNLNEAEILAIARNRNEKRGIDNNRVMRLRGSDL